MAANQFLPYFKMAFRSRTIRLVIFVSTFIIAAIVIFQLIWLRKVYYFEQKEFDHAIAKAVRGVYEDIKDSSVVSYTLSDLITNPNEQTFFARLGRTKMNKDSLGKFLLSELEDEDVFTDCYAGFYNSSKKQYAFTVYLPSATADQKEDVVMPVFNVPYNYLVLFFPHRNKYILSKMNFWMVSSVFLLMVLILLGSSIYYLYRQKFLNEIQKDFVNNFTHEFKTPVSVINLAAEVLTNPATIERPEKVARYASIVQYQGKYLQDQIERLLRHAHSESHLLHLKKRKLDVHEVIEEALSNLQTLIASRQGKVNCCFRADDPYILADRGYLLIVITNLIENALKYSKDPKITISTRTTHSGVVFSVRDNGKGIEKKYQQKIFNKFYRVPHGEQVSERGFGLGLAFVKRIVQAHHGKIDVESQVGTGSEFSIFLPAN